MKSIKGEFAVKMLPLELSIEAREGIQLGRLSLEKYFDGPLKAESRGEMISALTPVKGSAGYIALEQVVGSLEGKTGSFVLQHFGLMNRGEQTLNLAVVPDSGTGELEGLHGTMRIIIENGKHHYEFDYELSNTH